MVWVKRRLQILGSLLVALLLVGGFYLLYHDLYSFVFQQQQVLEKTAFTAAHLVPTPSVENALATKDSQTESDSQLQDRLVALQADLNVSGGLSLIDTRQSAFKVLASS